MPLMKCCRIAGSPISFNKVGWPDAYGGKSELESGYYSEALLCVPVLTNMSVYTSSSSESLLLLEACLIISKKPLKRSC